MNLKTYLEYLTLSNIFLQDIIQSSFRSFINGSNICIIINGFENCGKTTLITLLQRAFPDLLFNYDPIHETLSYGKGLIRVTHFYQEVVDSPEIIIGLKTRFILNPTKDNEMYYDLTILYNRTLMKQFREWIQDDHFIASKTQ